MITYDDGEYIVVEGVCIPVKDEEPDAVLRKMQKVFGGDRAQG